LEKGLVCVGFVSRKVVDEWLRIAFLEDVVVEVERRILDDKITRDSIILP
jgi:hypothetical protein